MKIGMFTYSTEPRGSVVHATWLSEALAARVPGVSVLPSSGVTGAGARIRIRWFPQDAQDALLLVALPVWLLPAALLLWCLLALLRGRRERRCR